MGPISFFSGTGITRAEPACRPDGDGGSCNALDKERYKHDENIAFAWIDFNADSWTKR